MSHKKDSRVYRMTVSFDNGMKDIFSIIEEDMGLCPSKIIHDLVRETLPLIAEKVEFNPTRFKDLLLNLEIRSRSWHIDEAIRRTISNSKVKGGNTEWRKV